MSEPIKAEQVFECIGKGGEYTVVATAIGAGTLKEHECLFVYRNADGIHFVRTHDDFWERMQETGKSVHAGEKLHPLQQCLRDNGELIALKATVAQQAQMIEHLRGGSIPCYTTTDIANADADGYKNGFAAAIKSLPEQKYFTNWAAYSEWRAAQIEAVGDLGGEVQP